MMTKLPELFDRNFVIGFFLPVAVFLAAVLMLARTYGFLTQLSQWDAGLLQVLLGTTLFGLLSWFIGILLLACNRSLIGLLEGYGRLNPLQLLYPLERRRFEKVRAEIKVLDAKFEAWCENRGTFSQDEARRRTELLYTAAERFPDDDAWLLPTSFGNVIRAFEVYPRVMYGIDSIPGWNRLVAVIPKEYLEYVDAAKASVDFWVNLGLASLVFVILYAGIAIYYQALLSVWLPMMGAIAAVASYYRARCSACEWGNAVKSCFDVFLGDLGMKLGFDQSRDLYDKTTWENYTIAILTSDPRYLPKRSMKHEDSQEVKAVSPATDESSITAGQ